MTDETVALGTGALHARESERREGRTAVENQEITTMSGDVMTLAQHAPLIRRLLLIKYLTRETMKEAK